MEEVRRGARTLNDAAAEGDAKLKVERVIRNALRML
jgi:hypothetical protein